MNKWRRLVSRDWRVGDGVECVSTENEARVALLASGVPAEEVRRMLASVAEDSLLRVVTRPVGAGPVIRSPLFDALREGDERDVVRLVGNIGEPQFIAVTPHDSPLVPWLDAAVMGFPDYPRSPAGYLSTAERGIARRAVA